MDCDVFGFLEVFFLGVLGDCINRYGCRVVYDGVAFGVPSWVRTYILV